MYIDSHSHLYLDAFDQDRPEMVRRAIEAGVDRILLPNIDSRSTAAMLAMAGTWPVNCFPMMGLHPTSVKKDYRQELAHVEKQLEKDLWVGIGECGIDLYWDKSYLKQQEEVFSRHIRWALERDLPLVIHARESFSEIFRVMDREAAPGLRGVFHSFSGGADELEKALSYGFMIGINGIVTFKNSSLKDVVERIPAERILLETDAPFLTPHPHRGKRNESAYIPLIAQKVAEIHQLSTEAFAGTCRKSTLELFNRVPDEK